ncbi:DNA-invertase [Sterolibacterium denitrificans]|uniref:DNA-invertase n=1 Tax=Sterolibacterium denitrificans TaxID=157592 RepID=A0A7Z7HTS5_9PROT|nr:recombinase family protein [Sterolibacterium denitrificans]SMB28102.1 DNA-invertase [Sterolibacterium denitrificans]
MIYGYARVSTQEQETRAQVQALKAAGVSVIFEEKRSGGDRRRPVLADVLKKLRRGDTLVVFKLDRVARSLQHLLEVLAIIEAKQAHFVSLTETIETKSPAGRMMLQILGAFAEFEREMIRERTRAGMQAAVKNGVRLGRPYGIPIELQPEMMRKWETGTYTKTALAREYNVHISSIKRTIRRQIANRRPNKV